MYPPSQDVPGFSQEIIYSDSEDSQLTPAHVQLVSSLPPKDISFPTPSSLHSLHLQNSQRAFGKELESSNSPEQTQLYSANGMSKPPGRETNSLELHHVSQGAVTKGKAPVGYPSLPLTPTESFLRVILFTINAARKFRQKFTDVPFDEHSSPRGHVTLFRRIFRHFWSDCVACQKGDCRVLHQLLQDLLGIISLYGKKPFLGGEVAPYPLKESSLFEVSFLLQMVRAIRSLEEISKASSAQTSLEAQRLERSRWEWQGTLCQFPKNTATLGDRHDHYLISLPSPSTPRVNLNDLWKEFYEREWRIHRFAAYTLVQLPRVTAGEVPVEVSFSSQSSIPHNLYISPIVPFEVSLLGVIVSEII